MLDLDQERQRNRDCRRRRYDRIHLLDPSAGKKYKRQSPEAKDGHPAGRNERATIFSGVNNKRQVARPLLCFHRFANEQKTNGRESEIKWTAEFARSIRAHRQTVVNSRDEGSKLKFCFDITGALLTQSQFADSRNEIRFAKNSADRREVFVRQPQ